MYVYYPICSRNFTGYLFIVNPDAVESGVKVEEKPDFNSDTANLRITWDTRMFPHDILADDNSNTKDEDISTKTNDDISTKTNDDLLKIPNDISTDDISPGHKNKKGPLDIWINFLDNEEMVWYRGYKLAEGIPNTGNADFSINIDQLPEEVLNHPTTLSVEPRDTEEEEEEEEDSYSHEPDIHENKKISKEDQKKIERRIDQSKMKPWMKIGTKLLLRTLIRASGPLGWVELGAFQGFGQT